MLQRPPDPFSFFGIAIAIIVVGVDQTSKVIVEVLPQISEGIDVLPFLALYHAHNRGIALSFFSGSGLAITATTLAATAIIIGLWYRARNGGQFTAAAFALILGGAIGNLMDRLRLGFVTDFLAIHDSERIFFVFNLADVAVTIGLLLLICLPPTKRWVAKT